MWSVVFAALKVAAAGMLVYLKVCATIGATLNTNYNFWADRKKDAPWHDGRSRKNGSFPVMCEVCFGGGCVLVCFFTVIKKKSVFALTLSCTTFRLCCIELDQMHVEWLF